MTELTEEEKLKVEAYREAKKEEFAKKLSDERVAKAQAKAEKEEEVKAKGWKRVIVEKVKSSFENIQSKVQARAKMQKSSMTVPAKTKTKTVYVATKKKGKTVYVPVKKKVKIKTVKAVRTPQSIFGSLGVNYSFESSKPSNKKSSNGFGVDWGKY